MTGSIQTRILGFWKSKSHGRILQGLLDPVRLNTSIAALPEERHRQFVSNPPRVKHRRDKDLGAIAANLAVVGLAWAPAWPKSPYGVFFSAVLLR